MDEGKMAEMEYAGAPAIHSFKNIPMGPVSQYHLKQASGFTWTLQVASQTRLVPSDEEQADAKVAYCPFCEHPHTSHSWETGPI